MFIYNDYDYYYPTPKANLQSQACESQCCFFDFARFVQVAAFFNLDILILQNDYRAKVL